MQAELFNVATADANEARVGFNQTIAMLSYQCDSFQNDETHRKSAIANDDLPAPVRPTIATFSPGFT